MELMKESGVWDVERCFGDVESLLMDDGKNTSAGLRVITLGKWSVRSELFKRV